MKRMICGLLALIAASLLLTGCPGPTDDPIPADLTITHFDIPEVGIPAAWGTTVYNLYSAQYTGTVSWSPEVSGTFAAATVYTATITLSPKTGYTLMGVKANSFTVDGATSVTHSAGSGVVSAFG